MVHWGLGVALRRLTFTILRNYKERFLGNVQSPIEYYLTENKKELIRQTHLLLLWILLGKDKMKRSQS